MSMYHLVSDISGRYLSKINGYGNVVTTTDNIAEALSYTRELAYKLTALLQDNGINMTARIINLPTLAADSSTRYILYNSRNFMFYQDTVAGKITWASRVEDATKLDITMAATLVSHIMHLEGVGVDIIRHPISVAGIVAIASAEPVCLGYTVMIGKGYYSVFNRDTSFSVDITTNPVDCLILPEREEADNIVDVVLDMYGLEGKVCDVVVNVLPKESVDAAD